MQYTVRLYYNTGFNAVNIPDGPALLNSMTYRDFPSQDLLQNKELPTISVFASYDDVVNADYLCVFNSHDAAFYAIDGVSMSDPGTVVFSLIYDEITTAGGVSAITILDGMTERHHIATADDTFGAFTEEDPYLVASKPLELIGAGSYPTLSGDKYVIAQSTAKLTQMGFAKDEPLAKKCVQYESGTEVAEVTIPEVTPVSRTDYTKTSMQGIGTDHTPGMALYILDDDNQNSTVGEISSDGIAVLQSLGAADAVKNCYSIPKEYVNSITNFTDSVVKADGTTGSVSGEHIDTIVGKSSAVSTQVISTPGYEYEYETVKNKRVLYGEMNKYGLVAKATGDGCTYKPEEIYHVGDTAPTVDMYNNPAPDGCPYFRFRYLHNNNDNPFMNCVTGAVWQNAPLVFTDKSGSVLDTIKLQASQAVARDQQNIENMGVKNVISEARSNLLKNLFKYDQASSVQGMFGMGRQLNENELALANATFSQTQARNRALRQEQAMEDINLGFSQVVAPTVNFPRSSGLRDYVGNNVFIYRYRPQATDLAKQDKILTMYGYRDTAPLTSAMFTNRSKFNYIKASGVSVKVSGANASKRLADGISAVLNNGIRIWHVAPDPAIYTNGTNV